LGTRKRCVCGYCDRYGEYTTITVANVEEVHRVEAGD
jgi:hypothetical protein